MGNEGDKRLCSRCGQWVAKVGLHACVPLKAAAVDKVEAPAARRPQPIPAKPKAAHVVKNAEPVKNASASRTRKERQPVKNASKVAAQPEPGDQPALNASTRRTRRWREANREKSRAYMQGYMQRYRGKAEGGGA